MKVSYNKTRELCLSAVTFNELRMESCKMLFRFSFLPNNSNSKSGNSNKQ